jgi:membrane associated rhomboid family serine protease
MKSKYYALKLCLLCIVVFFIQLFSDSFTDLLLLNSEAFYQPWRFLTSIFLHGSVTHLLYNIFALALFGTFLESFIGSKKFLLLFLATGIVANLIAVNFYPSSLGASGAIFGVIGALVVIRPGMIVWAFGLPMPLFIAGVLWATGDFIGLFVPSNIGNIAHLSGMFLGLIFGLFFRDWKRRKRVVGGIIIEERSIRRWEDNYLK